MATASGLLACQPSLPERVASWRGCPRVQSPRASLHRGSSMLSPRSTGTTAPGPATCQLGLPQPDGHPQPGYKSGVPWDPAPSSPQEALSWEAGAGIFLPLAWSGLRVCCFSAASGLDFLTIKMSVFALDPEVPHRLRSLTLSGCIWEATVPQSQGLSFPLEPRGASRCRKLPPSALPLPPHHPSPCWGGGRKCCLPGRQAALTGGPLFLAGQVLGSAHGASQASL